MYLQIEFLELGKESLEHFRDFVFLKSWEEEEVWYAGEQMQ